MPFTRGIGIPELVIILVIVMIIFGVGRLPEVGGALGKAIREFRKSQTEKAEAVTDGEPEEQENKVS
jgi:sec-independent protein translocase protein TatA